MLIYLLYVSDLFWLIVLTYRQFQSVESITNLPVTALEEYLVVVGHDKNYVTNLSDSVWN
jgi:hypothetical protein